MDFYTVVEGKQKVVETPDHRLIRTIEWEMMDKTKFFPLSMLSSFTVRCALYPLTLIKTRLQIQKHNNLYTGNIRKRKMLYVTTLEIIAVLYL